MSIVTAAVQPLTLVARALRGMLRAWRGITAEQIGLAALLGLAALAQVLMRFWNQPGAAVGLLMEAFNMQLGAFALLLAVVAADRAIDHGFSRTLAYTAAVFAGAGLGVAAQVVHVHVVWDSFNDPNGPIFRFVAENPRFVPMRTLSALLEWLIIDGLATYIYADRREARRIAARLHQAQLQRTTQARRVLESQLQAMQARVEPRFLFNTLARVRRLYEEDAARAERMLDDLIAYLRAAMPRMRDTSSTLAQEIRLARAYLDIASIRLGEHLSVTIDVASDIRQARVPPMMLLPLIDLAINEDGDVQPAGRTLRIAADAANGKLRVSVADCGAAFAPDIANEGVAGIRERLAALYGAEARLELRRCDERSEAVMEIPYEIVESGDR